MSHHTNPSEKDPANSEEIREKVEKDIQPQDPQPESGFTDREERMSIRQSSPTNPRVSNKPEINQEEA